MFGTVLISSTFIYSRHKKNLQLLCCTMNIAVYLIILLFVLQTVHWLIWRLLWHWILASAISTQPSMGHICSTATITVSVIAFIMTNMLAIKNTNQTIQFIVVIDHSQHRNRYIKNGDNHASWMCVCNATWLCPFF